MGAWAVSSSAPFRSPTKTTSLPASALTFDALLAAIPFILLLLVGLTHAARLSSAAPPGELNSILEHFLPGHDTTPATIPSR
jgi:hypothetical protein